MMRIANIQYTAQPSESETLGVLVPLMEEAGARGAELIALPECATIMAQDHRYLLEEVGVEAENQGLKTLSETARRLGCWVLIGSLLLRADGAGEKMVNRSFLLAPDGTIHAHYDKIHGFDAEVGDGQVYRESEHYRAGTEATLAHTPMGAIGMTICYDLRFPLLYQCLAQAGAEILTIPAAFTHTTGKAHWHTLVKARAIETGCFVIAPAQTGIHDGGRQTFGHGLIIDPWGAVLSDAGTAVGVATADIDLSAVAKARSRISAILHPRHFTLKKIGSTQRQ